MKTKRNHFTGRLLKKVISAAVIFNLMLCAFPAGLINVNAAEPEALSVNNTTQQIFDISNYKCINVKGTTNDAEADKIKLLPQKNPLMVSIDLVSNGNMKAIKFGASQGVSLTNEYDCSLWKQGEAHTVTLIFYPDKNYTDPGTADGADYTFKSDLYIDNEPAVSHTQTLKNTGEKATYKFSELRFHNIYNSSVSSYNLTVNAVRITNKTQNAEIEKPSFYAGTSFYLIDNKIYGYTNKTVKDIKTLNQNASVFKDGAEAQENDKLTGGMTVKLTNAYDTVSLSSSYVLADTDSGIFASAPQGYSNGYPSDKFTEGTFTVKTSVSSYGNPIKLTGYLVQFDSNGRLVKCSANQIEAVSTPKDFEISINIDKATDSTLKFMLWDSELKPCINAVAFKPYTASKLEVVKTYPNFSTKAATFSFDDGISQDIELIKVLDECNAKATFYLVGSRLKDNFKSAAKSENETETEIYNYVKELYKNHEIGNHTYKHTPADLEDGKTRKDSQGNTLTGVSEDKLVQDVNDNQKFIKENLDATTRGIAWPNGLPFNRSDYNAIKKGIETSGHVFTRDTDNAASFELPTNWMQWKTNGHISQMTDKTNEFINISSTDGLKLLYIWGHSYEFGENTAVGTLEKFKENLNKLKNANVWFATNGEVYDYANAMNKLSISDDVVTNHSNQTLYLYVNGKKITLEPNGSYSPASLTIACWGDSLTYGQGATNESTGVNSYPGVLASKIPNAKVYNLGVGGETALTIAARQGVVDITAADEFTIPKSGSVDIPLYSIDATIKKDNETSTKKLYYFSDPNGKAYIIPRSDVAGRWNPVTIAGVEGTLAVEVSYDYWPRLLTKATFTRKAAGDAVKVEKNTKFITSASQINKIADVNMFFTGTNGGWNYKNTNDDPQDLIKLIDSQIDSTKNKDKYIVIGLTNGDANAHKDLNKKLKEKYKEHFIDAKAYFTSEEALSDAGVTSPKYATDGTAIPTDFLCGTDTVHFNDLGYRLLANLVYEKLSELGYLN